MWQIMALYLQNYKVDTQDILPLLWGLFSNLIPIFTAQGYSPLPVPLPNKNSYYLHTIMNVTFLTAI